MSPVLLAFAGLLLAACCTDVWRLKIPNVIPLAILGLFALAVLFGGVADPLGHLQALLLTLAILVPLFALGMLGGGDVKLLAAVALWLGMSKLALLLIAVGIMGGVFAALWLPLRALLRRGLPRARLPESLLAGAPLPFALPITLIALPLAAAG